MTTLNFPLSRLSQDELNSVDTNRTSNVYSTAILLLRVNCSMSRCSQDIALVHVGIVYYSSQSEGQVSGRNYTMNACTVSIISTVLYSHSLACPM